jgi:hypothetical protein
MTVSNRKIKNAMFFMMLLLQLTPSRLSLASTGCNSMPRDVFVHNNLLTILVCLDDRITPTQLGFNMSQLVRNFRPDWIALSERLI